MKPIGLSNMFWLILALILMAGNFYFGLQYSASQKELRQTQIALETQKTNEKVLAQWNNFVNSKTETEAQKEVKNLLEMLVSKIKTK